MGERGLSSAMLYLRITRGMSYGDASGTHTLDELLKMIAAGGTKGRDGVVALGGSCNEQIHERNWKSTPPGIRSLWGGGNWNPAD